MEKKRIFKIIAIAFIVIVFFLITISCKKEEIVIKHEPKIYTDKNNGQVREDTAKLYIGETVLFRLTSYQSFHYTYGNPIYRTPHDSVVIKFIRKTHIPPDKGEESRSNPGIDEYEFVTNTGGRANVTVISTNEKGTVGYVFSKEFEVYAKHI